MSHPALLVRASERWHPLALVPLALSAWVYFPITRVFFFADDFYHLEQIANGRGLGYVIEPFAGHNLIVRNLVFMGFWHLFGLRAELWYATVLLTHLVNVWLLFGVIRTLTGRVSLACFGATLWGISPFAVDTLGWYTVYGQALVATTLLLVLDQVTRVADPRRAAWAWYALLLAGSTCFGMGIGVAVVFPLVLFLLSPAAWQSRSIRVAYLVLPAVTLGLYFAVRWASVWIEPLGFAPELFRELPGARGLAYVPAMLVALVGAGVAGTVLGHGFEAARFPNVLDWTAFALLAGGLALIAWRGDARARRTMLAMAALAVGIYGVIAVGRAGVYAFFKANLTFAATGARYHYVGTVPLTILLCLMLDEVATRFALPRLARPLLLWAGLAVVVVAYAQSNFHIDEHAGTRAYFGRTVQEMAEAVAASPPHTTLYLENEALPAHFFGPKLMFPGRAAVFLLVAPSDQFPNDRPVRFIEREPAVRHYWEARPSARMSTLLVAPDHAE